MKRNHHKKTNTARFYSDTFEHFRIRMMVTRNQGVVGRESCSMDAEFGICRIKNPRELLCDSVSNNVSTCTVVLILAGR